MSLPSWLRPFRPYSIRRSSRRSQSVRLRLEVLEERITPTGPITLNAANAAQLQADVALVNGNPTQQYIIQLTGSSSYNLTAELVLSNKAGVTIVGSNSILDAAANHRVFQVASGANLTLQKLAVEGGRVTAQGGGILDLGGTLALTNVVVQSNSVLATPGGDAQGGGIYVAGGTLTITNSIIQNNVAEGGNGTPSGKLIDGGSGLGGGIYASGASLQLTIAGTSVSNNSALGGQGGHGLRGADGIGEVGNGRPGGPGGDGGTAAGGGLYLASDLSANLVNDSFSSNKAVGGGGGIGGAGGNGASIGSGGPGGPGGMGGNGLGGGLYVAGSISVINNTVATNSASGGTGGTGGTGGSGYYVGGTGGKGGPGGSGEGGGVYDTASASNSYLNNTVVFNTVTGGPGGAGGANGPPNQGTGPAGGSGSASGGGFFIGNSAPIFINNLLQGNQANSGPDYAGRVNSSASNNFVSNASGATTFNPATNILNDSTNQLGSPLTTSSGLIYYPLLPFTKSVNGGTDSVLPTIASAEGVPPSQATDEIGNPRVISSVIDLGAVEFPGVTTTVKVPNVSTTYSPTDQNIAVSATITAPGSTVNEGSVTFTVTDSKGNTVGKPVTVNKVTNGSAQTQYTLPGGTAADSYTINAVYSDSKGNYAGDTGKGTLTVSPASTAVTVVPSTTTVQYSPTSQPISVGATVTSPNSTVNEGSVTYTVTDVTGKVVGSGGGPVSNGAAPATITLAAGTPAGTYTITAVYHDVKGNYSDSTGTGKLIVTADPTTLSIPSTTTVPYSPTSQTISVTATVTSPNSTVIEGTVTLTVIDATGKQIATGSNTVSNGSTVVTLSLPAGLLPKTYTINASYHDVAGNYADSSGQGKLIVEPVPLSSAVPIVSVPYTILDPQPRSNTITLTANLTDTKGIPINEGEVQFAVTNSAGAQLGATVTGPVHNGQASALFTVPPQAARGNYIVTANYSDNSPDPIFANSSGTGTLTVVSAPTTVTINNVSISYTPFGEVDTFTAFVLGDPQIVGAGFLVNEGSVTITDSGQTKTVPVVNSVATATFFIPFFAEIPFTHSISAAFSPSDNNYLPSSSIYTISETQIIMSYLLQILALESIMNNMAAQQMIAMELAVQNLMSNMAGQQITMTQLAMQSLSGRA